MTKNDPSWSLLKFTVAHSKSSKSCLPETHPVHDIHLRPGPPLAILASASIKF